ncbi:anti-sigma factor domain-containing protein [uncultured Jatrophihabitans sp.]|uniref:anti-sigma factor domain-containing protein n=1 Tax=uncultured Jatrophihabitans sp. TaxID=1610747 RepID=UPI0035CAB418
MSSHITEDIPRLLTGEATRDAVLSAAEHLRSCPDCQQELVSAVVAHASLTSAHRFAPEIVAATRPDDSTDDGSDDDGPPAGLPPMTSMFEKIREEAEQATHRKHAAPKRRRLVAVAAAAVILVGGGVAITEVSTSSSSSSQHTLALTAFDKGHTQARLTIVGDRKVRIDASKLPRLDSNHVYELWLTDGARTQMQSVGLLGNDNTADLTVPSKSLKRYDNFEVSIQRTNQVKYSGISVLRGQYQQ